MVFKNKNDSNEEHFWLSATDMMAALSIFFILLLTLVILFLNTSKDEVFTPLEATEPTWYSEPKEDGLHFEETYHTENIETVNDDHSGDGEGGTEAATEEPTEIPTVNEGDGTSEYAAVFVTVVDAETGDPVKRKNIEFELYHESNGIGGLQILHSYYPEITEYKKFETDEDGTFYLPEKIPYGWYSLHNLATPDGYYTDEKTDFEIDSDRHWTEPYEVTVYLKPIKNIIRIKAEDYDTKDKIENAVYRIMAAEDIKAADGTVRFSSGEKVDEITTDESGYAESGELYVGKYHIKQISAPEYYAVNTKSYTASVGASSGEDDNIVTLDCYKSRVTIRLTDKLTEEPIEGAVYSIEGRDDLVTDSQGEIVIDDLEKLTTYKLTVSSLPHGYIKEHPELSFVVDIDGLINDEASVTIEDSAYTLSLSVEVQDLIFGHNCAGIDLVLTDESGEVVERWTSSDNEYIVTGLTAGTYYLQRDNDPQSRINAEIKDTAELQNARMRIWDTIDTFAILILVGAVIICGIVLVVLINRRKKGSHNRE